MDTTKTIEAPEYTSLLEEEIALGNKDATKKATAAAKECGELALALRKFSTSFGDFSDEFDFDFVVRMPEEVARDLAERLEQARAEITLRAARATTAPKPQGAIQ